MLTFGSHGKLEAFIPMTDDERVDVETHLKGRFGQSVAIQVKAAQALYRHGVVQRLQKRFSVRRDRLVDDPFFLYFFGCMPIVSMTYIPPVFVVPSHVVHTHAVHRIFGEFVEFNFVASMSPNSRDRFHKWGMPPNAVGDYIVDFLRSHRKGSYRVAKSGLGQSIPGTIWVGRVA